MNKYEYKGATCNLFIIFSANDKTKGRLANICTLAIHTVFYESGYLPNKCISGNSELHHQSKDDVVCMKISTYLKVV